MRSTSSKQGPASLDFLEGGGEMGALMRAHDWAASDLGDPSEWPQSLRTPVRLLLNTGHPMYIFWGETGACFYNDAYRQSIGPERHPGSLGRPVREVWDEIWDIIGPQIEQVMAGRGATWHENHLVPITRNGKREDVYWTYSYSPIDDETAPNGVGGVLVVCSETTQIQRARAEADRDKRRLAELFQQAPSFMVLLQGPEHRVEFANAAYFRLVGGRDVLGKTIAEALPEAVEQGYLALLDNVYRSGQVFSSSGARYAMQAFPGGPVAERFLDFVYQPIIGADGRVSGIFVEGIEVTERRRAEMALQELNATLEARVGERTREYDRVWRHSRDLMVVIGADGIFRAISPAWTAVLGHTPEDVVGHSFLEFIHPEDARWTQSGLDMAASGKDLTNFENRYLHKDGHPRWISWHTSMEGDLVYANGRDITAEKLAKAELVRSKARLRQIFETSYQFQGLVSLDGILLEANATLLEAIGCAKQDVVGKPFPETAWFIGTPGMAHTVREGIAAAAAGQMVRQEIRVNLPVGGWRWFDFTLRPIRDDHGEVIAIVPEAVELTKRKLAEEALRQSQKLEAMGQLTGGVAHDFNNLLTPIVGTLDMLQRRNLGGEREQRLIDGALQSADRAKTLVQRLLAFARRQPLQPVAVDVYRLVTGMAELIASTTGPQIKVVVNAAENLPAATADPNQLEMAILNLSVNARDAMTQGGTLRISATEEMVQPGHPSKLEPGHYIRLSVADSGIGMDEATLARAVEPFFSTKGVGKGTGLGLSMAHGLASQLNGALTLSSKPGVGTNVELWLPVSPDPVRARTEAQHAEQAPEAVGTALLVDDEDLVRMSTADMLTELGFAVREAGSAQEALRAIDRGLTFDLLITDHLMPGMSGVDLAHAVRERYPEMPVLIISGFAEVEGIASDLPRLNKPFTQADLAAYVAGLPSFRAR